MAKRRSGEFSNGDAVNPGKGFGQGLVELDSGAEGGSGGLRIASLEMGKTISLMEPDAVPNIAIGRRLEQFGDPRFRG